MLIFKLNLGVKSMQEQKDKVQGRNKSKSSRNSSSRVHFICNLTAMVVEIVGIVVVCRGNYLERLYCQDIYAHWISLGAIIFAAGNLIQKKLPWAHTRFGRKKNTE